MTRYSALSAFLQGYAKNFVNASKRTVRLNVQEERGNAICLNRPEAMA